MRLYLVRHPPTVVAAGVCYGSTDLDVLPAEHAAVAERLSPLLPRAARLFSSPLARCAGLATLLADALGSLPPTFDQRLVEMDFGAWEMRAWNDIARGDIDAWCADRLAYRPGGGETVLQVAQRVLSFLRDLETQRTGSAIVVCHAGTVRMLQASASFSAAADVARHAFDQPSSIGYGELHILDFP
jgi:alpha-ribazole phosphatase